MTLLYQAFLAIDKTFESGLKLKKWTPIRVELGERIYEHKCDGFGNGRCGPEEGCGFTDRRKPGLAYYYDNPMNYGSHVFVVCDDEYALLKNAKTDEYIAEVPIE